MVQQTAAATMYNSCHRLDENMLLLDKIRKDVIRKHPDLRFFLELYKDLGQKHYAALKHILYI